MKDFKLTKNFWYHEFCVSYHEPELADMLQPLPIHVNNLHLLCSTILQPVRDYADCSVLIISGYRDFRLNAAIGGAIYSRHLLGKAADFTLADWTKTEQVYWFIIQELPFAWGELIWKEAFHTFHIALPHSSTEEQLLKRIAA